MSLAARYFSSRRRLPTSWYIPRREWWSCLCALRCSVRSLIRLVSSATWTSGEPVSPSAVPYSARICFFVATSSDIGLLRIVSTWARSVCVTSAGEPTYKRAYLRASVTSSLHNLSGGPYHSDSHSDSVVGLHRVVDVEHAEQHRDHRGEQQPVEQVDAACPARGQRAAGQREGDRDQQQAGRERGAEEPGLPREQRDVRARADQQHQDGGRPAPHP